MTDDWVQVVDGNRAKTLLHEPSLAVEKAPEHRSANYVAFAADYDTGLSSRWESPWQTVIDESIGDPPEEYAWFFQSKDAQPFPVDDYFRKRNYEGDQ